MSTSHNAHHGFATLDVVELVVDSGRWGAGTMGTVLEASKDSLLVEIDDEQGHSLDFIVLPGSAVRKVYVPAQEHLAV
jgi:hypothetical protein